MNTFSRRSLLAGAAVVPVTAALPALAAISSAPAADPDAGLKALFDELGKAIDAWQAYVDGPQKEAEARYAKLAPPRARVPDFPKMPAKLARQIPRDKTTRHRDGFTVGEYTIMKKFAPEHPAIVWHDRQMKEHMPKWRAWRKKADRAAVNSGVGAAEEEQRRLWEAYMEIFDEIMETPAHTPAGLATKALAIKLVALEPAGGENFSKEWAILEDDIMRIVSNHAGANS